jgi:hypothetical protein
VTKKKKRRRPSLPSLVIANLLIGAAEVAVGHQLASHTDLAYPDEVADAAGESAGDSLAYKLARVLDGIGEYIKDVVENVPDDHIGPI